MTLILLLAIPVGGAPALQVGSTAIYNLSISISFPPPICEVGPTSSSTAIVYCPMIATIPPTFDVNGTLGWTVTALNSTTAVLNVTRNATTTSWDSLTAVNFRSSHSINESIDLGTRVASLMPFLTPEIDQAFQTAQSSMSTNLDWSSSMNTIDAIIRARHPIYTMWWVNGPLQLNQTIPVLVIPTNVTRSTNINTENIGPRSAWTLSYNLTLPRPQPEQDTFGTYSIPAGDNLRVAFTFNYDQHSDLLLSATADIHLGFFEQESYSTSQCSAPATTCGTSFIPIRYGVNIEASLTLASTNLNLSQRLGSTTAATGDAASNPASGSGAGSGSSGTGTGSSGSGIGYDQGPGPGSGSADNTPGSGTGSNPGSTPQATSPQPSTTTIPWIYWILGIVAIAILVTGTLIARRRSARNVARATYNKT